MGVQRSIDLRIVSEYKYFSDIVSVLITNIFSTDIDGAIQSLRVDDTDDFDFIQYTDFDELKRTLNKREEMRLPNYIILWDLEVNETIIISCNRLINNYRSASTHHQISFNLGVGVRIKGAERYTDFGYYINKLSPVLLNNSIYICEAICNDLDC